jgi:TRAP-type transport system periplasmic protein
MRMLALLMAIAVVAAGSAQTVTSVRLGTAIPAGTIWHKILKEQVADWDSLTGGRVRLTVAAGTQGDEDAIIRKMRTSGQLQAASLSGVSLAMSVDQSFNVFFIPMFFQDYAELDYVMAKLEPLITQRLADKGFVFINWGSGGWVQVFSKKPAKNLRDLKGMKLFTSAGDDVTVQWYKDNGFQPVPLSSADMLSSLTTGMIEAVPVTPLSALSFQWYKYTPFMLDVGISPLVGATIINKKTWESISEADRAQLMAAARKTEARFRVEVPRTDAESIAVMQKSGLTLVKADPAALAEFRTVADGFTKTMRSDLVPRDVFELAVRERDAYRKTRPTTK